MAMNHECQIKQWLAGDEGRMQALRLAQQCGLPDWCLAAGFVRNLVRMLFLTTPSPLTQNDLNRKILIAEFRKKGGCYDGQSWL